MWPISRWVENAYTASVGDGFLERQMSWKGTQSCQQDGVQHALTLFGWMQFLQNPHELKLPSVNIKKRNTSTSDEETQTHRKGKGCKAVTTICHMSSSEKWFPISTTTSLASSLTPIHSALDYVKTSPPGHTMTAPMHTSSSQTSNLEKGRYATHRWWPLKLME